MGVWIAQSVWVNEQEIRLGLEYGQQNKHILEFSIYCYSLPLLVLRNAQGI
jgi:hypothetical protein